MNFIQEWMKKVQWTKPVLEDSPFSMLLACNKELKENRVYIQKITSYDVVANPGFTNATFTKVKTITEEKEYKRIYSDIDPFGEENWEN